MKLKQLFEEDDAVSPVIGVILMVAITVILAAVIATFVLGLGEQVSDTAPQASFSFDLEDDVGYDASFEDSWGNAGGDSVVNSNDSLLTMQHSGGPNIQANLLGASGSNTTGAADAAAGASSGNYTDFSTATTTSWADGEMSAGNRIKIWMANDDSISITWTSEDGTTSATLQTYDGPDS
jgi:flagellin-like protein